MVYKWKTDKELDALWDEIESIEDLDEREKKSAILSKLEAERWAEELRQKIYQRHIEEWVHKA